MGATPCRVIVVGTVGAPLDGRSKVMRAAWLTQSKSTLSASSPPEAAAAAFSARR
jgi:hypothetical protein